MITNPGDEHPPGRHLPPAFTISHERIVALDTLAHPGRLRRLDLTVLER